MNKKVIIITVAIVLVLSIGLIVFLFAGKGGGSPSLRDILPFGKPTGNPSTRPIGSGNIQENNGEGTTSSTLENPGEKGLRKISSDPVSGGTMFTNGSSTIIRYVEKATGHIYEVELDTSSKKRVSNTTIPKIEEVLWGIRGQSLVARFMKDNSLQSFFATIASSSASTTDGLLELDGIYWPINIVSVSFSPKKDRVFYITSSRFGAEGFVANSRGEKPFLLWKFPTTEWIAEWQQEDTISLTTKASFGLPGSLYQLNTKTGDFSLVISNISGLSTKVSPDGNKILYSESSQQGTSLKMLNKKTRTTSNIPLSTLADKCAWQNTKTVICGTPNEIFGTLPDSWYQGKVSFTDALWRIDTDHLTTENIVDLSNEEKLDIINIQVSSDGRTVLFVNKKDNSLWAIPVKPEPVGETFAD